MKALYIHGFQSSPLPVKVDALKEIFGEVIAPSIDWEDEETRKNLYQNLMETIKSEGVTHVIGSSMGGQMAFYLATNSKANGLCFNPAFDHMYFDLGYEMPIYITSRVKIVLGENDDVISPDKTFLFLTKNGFIGSVEIEYEDMGHQVDLETFTRQSKSIL